MDIRTRLKKRLEGRGNARLKAIAKKAHDPKRQQKDLEHLNHTEIEKK